VSELRPAPNGHPIKLVRDRTPTIVNPSREPGKLFYADFDGDVLPWLKKKLGEEVAEYLVDGGASELLDVLAVLDGLALQHGTTLSAMIDELRAEPRGSMTGGVMMYGLHPEFDLERRG
jgi:predicted house-cleaning noncanonical NTP pyrophosphatase (MazG superfamily)